MLLQLNNAILCHFESSFKEASKKFRVIYTLSSSEKRLKISGLHEDWNSSFKVEGN